MAPRRRSRSQRPHRVIYFIHGPDRLLAREAALAIATELDPDGSNTIVARWPRDVIRGSCVSNWRRFVLRLAANCRRHGPPGPRQPGFRQCRVNRRRRTARSRARGARVPYLGGARVTPSASSRAESDLGSRGIRGRRAGSQGNRRRATAWPRADCLDRSRRNPGRSPASTAVQRNDWPRPSTRRAGTASRATRGTIALQTWHFSKRRSKNWRSRRTQGRSPSTTSQR